MTGKNKIRTAVAAVAGAILSGYFIAMPESDAALELPAAVDGGVTIRHTGYVTCYNPSLCLPFWVAYELTEEETEGYLERDDRRFMMDPDFRGHQAMREDYSGSGWTKGHMAPAGDFHWNGDAMDETFYLTNICPQSEDLNKGDWQYLEKQVRKWAKQYGKVWVVTGPVVGDAVNGTIGEREVTVPDAFYKAVMVYTDGQYEAVGFVMGNDSERYWLRDCSMSINDLEKLTGIDFFPALDDSVEESVEDTFSNRIWGIS